MIDRAFLANSGLLGKAVAPCFKVLTPAAHFKTSIGLILIAPH